MSQRSELENYDRRWDQVDELEALARSAKGLELFKNAAGTIRDLLIENNRLKYQVATAVRVLDETSRELEGGRQRLANHIGDLTRETA